MSLCAACRQLNPVEELSESAVHMEVAAQNRNTYTACACRLETAVSFQRRSVEQLTAFAKEVCAWHTSPVCCQLSGNEFMSP